MIETIKKYVRPFRPFWWWGSDTRIGEVISSLCLWSWSATLLHPDVMFSSAFFRHFAAIADETTIGLTLGGIAALQSIAMCGNVYFFRLPSALLAAMAYMFLFAILFETLPMSPGVYIHLVLALVNIYTVIQGPSRLDK